MRANLQLLLLFLFIVSIYMAITEVENKKLCRAIAITESYTSILAVILENNIWVIK